MKKQFMRLTVLSAMILAISLIIIPNNLASAEIANGSHQVNYEMKEKSSDNTSIADGYFAKPATLIVKDGVKHIQLTVTSSDMIKSLSAPSGPVEVVSEGDGTRTVKFRVDGDLSQPVNMEMHIVVPDLYDTTHTARAVFDVSGLPTASNDNQDATGAGSDGGNTEKSSGNESGSDDGAGTPVDNPQTGDNTPIALYVILLISSIVIFAVYKLRFARN